VQLDSLPPELDGANRRVQQLEVERAALAKDVFALAKDAKLATRLKVVTEDLESWKERQAELQAEFEAGSDMVNKIQAVKKEIEETQWAIAINEMKFNTEKVADLKFEVLPEQERRLADFEERARRSKTAVSDTVGAEQVAAVVARWTGIPVEKLTDAESKKLLSLEETLRARVMGQDHAVAAVASAVIRSRAGLASPNRPVGSFMFLGTSGVGKTELARALAHELFDDESHMVRMDMTEYSEPHSVARLVGAPPGYIGHDEGGQLTEPVKRRPYCVVLFDEVEKAHQQVWKVLLQVLDAGRLTDAKGRTVDFTNTVVVFTSNLGSRSLTRAADLHGADACAADTPGWSAAEGEVLAEVKRHFVPEFLNRLDNIVVFRPLGSHLLRPILDLQVRQLLGPFSKEHSVSLELDDSAAEHLIESGHSAAEGARLLRKAVERKLLTPLARERVRGGLPDGSNVTVFFDGSLRMNVSFPPRDPVGAAL